MKRLVVAITGTLLLAGCGGAGAASGSGQSLDDIQSALGCPNATASTKLQQGEPKRDRRVSCHGLGIVTFDGADQQDAYLGVVTAAYEAFGGNAILSGDGWAVMGKKSAVKDAQDKIGGHLKK